MRIDICFLICIKLKKVHIKDRSLDIDNRMSHYFISSKRALIKITTRIQQNVCLQVCYITRSSFCILGDAVVSMKKDQRTSLRAQLFSHSQVCYRSISDYKA